ncbi:hypothetical protein G7Y89_g11026 [Cudoniella acicularis]|uniref:mannan endo-1,4-beta-mannosidase n=1 Tax=Cudoniella acicularis TaxID=354080 RepID=A0A8H4RCP7_9HELO|nr:hypothetical protein G7Y89_g11026 [Cudoniella acicularis]
MSINIFLTLLLASLGSASAAIPSGAASKVQPLASAISSIFPQGSTLTPQILQTFLEPNAAVLARNSYVYRNGTTLRLQGDLWTANGANVYWLGLDENVTPPAGEPYYAPFKASYPNPGRTTEVMTILVMMGAHLIRSQTLGISVGSPLSLMPSLGVFNEAAFEPMDWAIFQARQHGLRIIAPLTDDYDYYHGGKFTFLRWRGFNISGNAKPLPEATTQFYTNSTIISDFKSYIQHLLLHVNPYTGLTYAEDPTIIGYETGNELNGINSVINKFEGPKKLCIDGTYGINTTHFSVPEIDMFSNHFYPLNNSLLTSDIASVQSANRVYLAGEIDWRDLSGDSLRSFYDTIKKRKGDVVAGSIFWSLFGHEVPDCSKFVDHNDGLTLQYGNPNNTETVNSKISIIRQHYFAMQDVSVDSYLPAVACPHNYVPGYEAQYTAPYFVTREGRLNDYTLPEWISRKVMKYQSEEQDSFRGRKSLPNNFSSWTPTISEKSTRLLFKQFGYPDEWFADPVHIPPMLVEFSIKSYKDLAGRVELSVAKHQAAMGQYKAKAAIIDGFALNFFSITTALNVTSRDIALSKISKRVTGSLELALRHIEDLSRKLETDSKHNSSAMNTRPRHQKNWKIRKGKRNTSNIMWNMRKVYQYISQKDTKFNIQLAETSMTIAKASKEDSEVMRIIAIENKKDSNLLNARVQWDNNGEPVIKPAFEYFWATTLPLTALIFVSWVLIMKVPWKTWFRKVWYQGRKEGEDDAESLEVSLLYPSSRSTSHESVRASIRASHISPNSAKRD